MRKIRRVSFVQESETYASESCVHLHSRVLKRHQRLNLESFDGDLYSADIFLLLTENLLSADDEMDAQKYKDKSLSIRYFCNLLLRRDIYYKKSPLINERKMISVLKNQKIQILLFVFTN